MMDLMLSIEDELKKIFGLAVQEAFSHLASEERLIEITPSTQAHFGDYQCNSAMKLAKLLKKNPRQVAEEIVEKVNLQPNASRFSKLEVAGPGFINIFLTTSWLEELVAIMTQGDRLGIVQAAPPQRIVIDFCSPNTAKDMHVGHLRSAIIGDCLARLFEFLGHDVLRLSHVGDWGTSFGMLIAFLKEQHAEVLEGKGVTSLLTLEDWYREAKAYFDADADFRVRAQREVVALQGGDPVAQKAWELICAITRQGHQEILDLLDIPLEERGESFYNLHLPEVVRDLEEKGLVKVSDGAKCIFLDGFKNREGDPLPFMIQKSDGGYNYATTDLAALRHRVEEERADRILILTDAGQGSHFAMLFQVGALAGYYDPQKVRLDHVPFGLVLGEDGKKFRTRSGRVEKLRDLLDIAVEKAKEICLQRQENQGLSPVELEELSRALGIGAVKYADLSCARLGDYHFSYERMLRFDGNTAVFLLYAYVRIAGIKRRVGHEVELAHTKISLAHPAERALGIHLCRFAEVLRLVTEDLMPHHLTEYLYELAGLFNAFFRDCRVEGSEEQASRLALAELVARTLKTGLHLLGLKTVERM